MVCRTELITFNVADLLKLLGKDADCEGVLGVVEDIEDEPVEFDLDGLCLVLKIQARPELVGEEEEPALLPIR